MGAFGQFFVTQYQRLASLLRNLWIHYGLNDLDVKTQIAHIKAFYQTSATYTTRQAALKIRDSLKYIQNLRTQHSSADSVRYFAGLSIAVAITMVFSASYYIASSSVKSENLQEIRKEVHTYQDALNNIYKIREEEEDILLQKLAQLESQLVRIQSLGKYLKKQYKIKSNELNLLDQAGIGGSVSDSFPDQVYIPQIPLSQANKRLEERMYATKLKLDMILQSLAYQELQSDKRPSGFPTKRRWISSRYGYRISPVGSAKEFHRGIDIPGKEGQAVRAVASGIVEYAGHHTHYGNVVKINHADGYNTLYAHNQHLLVNAGDMIEKGKAIALLGNTGRSTGPHLHFEVTKGGRKVNPEPFLFKPRSRK